MQFGHYLFNINSDWGKQIGGLIYATSSLTLACFMLSERTARPQGQVQAELGFWPYLALMAFEIKIIIDVGNSMDKRSL